MAILGPAIGKFSAGRGRNRFGQAANIRVIGLSKVTADFEKMRKNSDSIMTKEIHRAAVRIAKRANREVPVDTGRLLRSIDVEKWTRAAAIHVKAPYALYVEKGTRYMKAQPYFFKHIDPEIKKLMANIKRLIK